jgi:hypothetical protein
MNETQTKSGQEVWDGLARDAEERAGRAAQAVRASRAAIEELEGDRRWLAVAATEGDEKARQKLLEIDEKIAGLKADAQIAELAREESARVARDHRRLAEEERALSEETERRAKYDELAGERGKLEKKAQRAMDSLVESLDRLAELDREQRVAARRAGVRDAESVGWLDTITNGWIAAYLRPHAPDLPFRGMAEIHEKSCHARAWNIPGHEPVGSREPA